MCVSCGCGAYYQKHDERAIDYTDVLAAAMDAGITPKMVASNIAEGVDAVEAEQGPDDLTKAEVGCQVLKTHGERRYTLGLAYGAYLPDRGRAADGFRDFATPEVLEDAAWSFLRKGRRVGLQHEDGTEGHGVVVESYIYRGPVWKCGHYEVTSGDWLIGVIWDEPTWKAIKAGEYNGFSPQGSARRRKPDPHTLSLLRRQ